MIRRAAMLVILIGGAILLASPTPGYAIPPGCTFCSTSCPGDLRGFCEQECGGGVAEPGTACALEPCSVPGEPTAPYTVYCEMGPS